MSLRTVRNTCLPRLGAALAVPALCLFALSGCGSKEVGDAAEDGTDSELTQIEGKVEIDGSSTVGPISEAAAEAFEETFTNVKITVAVSGTGGGFERFTRGEIDICDASRPIKASEFEACRKAGVGFVELPVAYDGLSIVVNKENDFIEQLTIEELKKIFLKEGEAKNWKDVNPQFPDLPIKIYSPGTDSGTFDYFFSDVVAKDAENEHPRDDMSVSEDDNVLVTGVAGEKGAIGFFGASYYFANMDKIRAVKIVNPENGEAVEPTAETIETGVYAPFSRPLFIYIKADALRRPELKQFINYYLKNAGTLAKKVDYVPLPEDIFAVVTKHYEDRLTGTHFLTPELDKRSGSLSELYTAENLVTTE